MNCHLTACRVLRTHRLAWSTEYGVCVRHLPGDCPAQFLRSRRRPERGAVGGQAHHPAAQRSIERGLKWLAAGQHDDGGFGSGPLRGNVAVSALAGMAMMSGGSTPGRGPTAAR